MSKTTTIVAFGDSITQAVRQPDDKKWIGLVEAKVRQAHSDGQFTFVNAGVGGNTSREGLARIDRDVLAHQGDIVLVEFGGNDATSDMNRHVSLDEFEANLAAIYDKVVHDAGATMVLLTFTPVVNEWHSYAGHEIYAELGGQDQYIEQYRQITRDFADERGLVVADTDRALRAEMARTSAGDYILDDGVHLTEGGNRVVADAVFSALEKVLRR